MRCLFFSSEVWPAGTMGGMGNGMEKGKNKDKDKGVLANDVCGVCL